MRHIVEEINSKLISGASHTFLFYLNVDDGVIDYNAEGKLKLEPLSNYLVNHSVLSGAKFVIKFSRGAGITFDSRKKEEDFLEFLSIEKSRRYPPQVGGENVAVDEYKKNKHELNYALQLFRWLLQISKNEVMNDEKFSSLFSEDEHAKSSPMFATVIDYVETIAPAGSSSGRSEDRDSLVTLLLISKDPLVRNAGNCLLMMADSILSIDPKLRSETSGIVPIKVPLPTFQDRKNIFTSICQPPPKNITPDEFGRFSGGISINVLSGIIKECALKGYDISDQLLFEKKKKYIDEASGGLLEVIRPIFSMDTIGALSEHKEFIRELGEDILSGNISAIPMGILLLGAPGTCKSLFAQVIANTLGLPFFKMKNTREKWVGQSERNLELSLEIAINCSPGIVFIDEIDQQLQQRSSVGDNTGVNQRMQARLFEVMSDTTLRGSLLWLAASNRPDLIDPAQLREGRFDLIIPFLPPSNKTEIELITKALLIKMGIKAKHDNSNFLFDLDQESITEFSQHAHHHVRGEQIFKCRWESDHPEGLGSTKDEESQLLFTGAQVEEILRRAHAFASREKKLLGLKHLLLALQDYPVSSNVNTHQEMSRIAISYCNTERFLPKSGRWAKFAKTYGQSGARSINSFFSKD